MVPNNTMVNYEKTTSKYIYGHLFYRIYREQQRGHQWSEQWLQIKLVGADDRSNWIVQKEIVYIRYFAASCIRKWNVDYYFF